MIPLNGGWIALQDSWALYSWEEERLSEDLGVLLGLPWRYVSLVVVPGLLCFGQRNSSLFAVESL